MPIYVFKCNRCGNEIEMLQKIGDLNPLCFNGDCNGEETVKVIAGSRIALDFKGSGWQTPRYKDKK